MEKNNKANSRSIITLLLTALIIFAFFYFLNSGDSGEYIDRTQAKNLLYSGQISDVYVINGTGYFRRVDSEIDKEKFPNKADYSFTYNNTSTDLDFIEEFDVLVGYAKSQTEEVVLAPEGYSFSGDITVLKEYNLDNFKYYKANPSASFLEKILPYLSLAFMVFLAFLFFRMLSGKGGGAGGFIRSKARSIEKSNIRFADMAGADEEKAEMQEIVEFLKTPTKFKALGARIPKGVLLVGPPGTGKTLLAKAVAGESNVPFFSISGSDFVELYVGVGASRVRDMFDTAKRNSPCIVFIDEIDAVGRQRGAGLGGGNDEREQTLNQLLVEMDGFENNEGIIVLAATNRADVLDPALMRPGRFDRQIYVHAPDVKGREGIMKIHAKNKPIDPEVDFKAIARLTSGFTGADIENFLNEAAILAARNNHVTINMADITEGINKVLMGPQKKSRLVTEKDRKLTAYHEAGHAIIAKSLDAGEDVHEVSIIPRGFAGGYTSTRPSDDDEHYTYSRLNSRICMLMGGRVAEELEFGDITAGASSDIKKATEIARRMVTEWGMSKKLGFLNLGKSEEVFIGRDYQVQNKYSESTASIIDEEIKSLIDENYKKTVAILKENKEKLDNMAKLLLQEETIYQEEVEAIMKGEDYKTISKRLEARLKKRKAYDEQKQKEQEILRKQKMQELKEQTAAALHKAGVISDGEFQAIKTETLELKKETEKLLEKVKKPKRAPKEESEKTEEKETKKPKTSSKKTSTKTPKKDKEDNDQKKK